MPPKLAGVKGPPGMPGGKKGLVGGGSPASSASNSPRKSLPGGKKMLPGGKGPALAGKAPIKAPMKAGALPAGKAPLGKAPMKGLPGKGGPPAKGALPAPGAAKAPAKGLAPPGKVPLKAAPGVPPLKKLPAPPSSGASAASSAGPSPPKLAGKAPGKLPLKAPGKLPLKAPGGGKLPLSKPPSQGGSVPPSEAQSVAPEEGVAPSPRFEGTRDEEPASPIETPRDMPSSATAHMASPSATPQATPRESQGIPPPPDTTPPETPRDGDSASTTPRAPMQQSTTTPAAVNAPQERLDDVLGGGLGRGGPPGQPGQNTNPPSPGNGPSGQPPYPLSGDPPRDVLSPSQSDLLASMRGGEWPSPTNNSPSRHGNFDTASPGNGSEGAVMRMQRERIEELEGLLRNAERKAHESEKFSQTLEKETVRLRETLYDREGAKVIQHISELERENRKLRSQMQKEKDNVLYHQQAHMGTMDELVKLRHSVDSKGDYDGLKFEYDRLTEQVTRLVRANTELSLKVAEMTEDTARLTCQPDQAGISGVSGSTFLRVRRGALCPTCLDMVDRWERAVAKRSGGPYGSAAGYGDSLSLPPSQSPIYSDPQTSLNLVSHSNIRTTGGWRVLQLEDGQVVYHNPITNTSTWDMPEELRRANGGDIHLNHSIGRQHHQQQTQQQQPLTPPPQSRESNQRQFAAFSTPPPASHQRSQPASSRNVTMPSDHSPGPSPSYYNAPLIPQGNTSMPSGSTPTYPGAASYDASAVSPYAVRSPNRSTLTPTGSGSGVGPAHFASGAGGGGYRATGNVYGASNLPGGSGRGLL